MLNDEHRADDEADTGQKQPGEHIPDLHEMPKILVNSQVGQLYTRYRAGMDVISRKGTANGYRAFNT